MLTLLQSGNSSSLKAGDREKEDQALRRKKSWKKCFVTPWDSSCRITPWNQNLCEQHTEQLLPLFPTTYLPKTIHTALIFVHNAKFCIFSLVKKSTLLFSRYYQNFFIWSNFSVKKLIQMFSPWRPFSTWYTFWHLLAWTWSSVEFYVPKKAIFSLQKQWSFIND